MNNEFESILKKLFEQSQKDVDIKGYIHKSINGFDEFLKEIIDDLSQKEEVSQSHKNNEKGTFDNNKKYASYNNEEHTFSDTDLFNNIYKNIEKTINQLNEKFSTTDNVNKSDVNKQQQYENIHNKVVETIIETLNKIIELKDDLLPNVIHQKQQSFSLLRDLFTNLSILEGLLMEYKIDDKAIINSHNKHIKDIFVVLNQSSNNHSVLKRDYPLLANRYQSIIQNIILIDKQIKELDKIDE